MRSRRSSRRVMTRSPDEARVPSTSATALPRSTSPRSMRSAPARAFRSLTAFLAEWEERSSQELRSNHEAIDRGSRVRELQGQLRVCSDGLHDLAQPPPIGLVYVLSGEIPGRQQPGKHDEVAAVATRVGVALVAVGGGFHHKCPNEVGTPDKSLAPIDSDCDGLAPSQRLRAAFGWQGRAASHTRTLTRPLADAFRQQHIDRRVPAPPTVLSSLRQDAGRLEPEVGQRLGEGVEDLGVSPSHR